MLTPGQADPPRSLRDLMAERWDGNGTAAEALELLEHHGASVTTALLVCTHRRFERCARTPVRNLAASDLLDEDQLTEVADALLWEDRIAFAVPAHWVAGPAPEGYRFRASGRDILPPGSAEARETLPYRCRPPAAARRWAPTWLLDHDAASVAEILAWADQLTPGAGGAAVSGVLDAAPALTSEQLEPAIRHVLAWPTSSVRLRALDVLDDAAGVGAQDVVGGCPIAQRAQADGQRRPSRWCRTPRLA